MPATMQVELVSVEQAIWSGEATMVIARTPDGEIGIMPGHAPLLGALVPGWVVRIARVNEPELRVAVHGGFLSVSAENVSVLAEMAEIAEDIDVERAKVALARAEGEEGPDAEAARERAQARLRAVGADSASATH
ncbi:ATP synthase F1 subcomplex epsilon subunit [Jatrophihabitans sp. GAS493]|uniref:F0F1 ATP synthase subunit epsilon n=1 Tax=Jatrophihabitans sp. GAS493 TaxID=1907575 RepID=UPI000BC03033|nr:F0F1 ATP synthase subunit epsilon [Jatrophihabitans sp. GAS493]SOD73316.1 ATP synthase F1 subcomplex epsilon subunit [Jatrophihabitans sp. GAS493]